jgi:hypothetical protein
MKTFKNILIIGLVVLVLVFIGYYAYLRVMLEKHKKSLFDNLALFQKAYSVSKLESEKKQLSKVLDKLDILDYYFATYDFQGLTNLEKEVNGVASRILERRKSAISSGAHIANIIGEGEYLQGGAELLKAEADINIKSGDILRLKKDSACKVIFIDGSTLNLSSKGVLSFNIVDMNRDKKILNVELTLAKGVLAIDTSKMSDFATKFKVSVRNVAITFGHKTEVRFQINYSPHSLSVFCDDGEMMINVNGKEDKLTLREMARISLTTGAVEKFKLAGTPTVESPTNFKVFELSNTKKITFKWKQIFNVAGYYFELSKDPLFAKPTVVKKSYSGTTLSIPIKETGVYYWRVASLNDANEKGRYTSTREFKVVATREHNLMADKTPPPLTLERIRMFGQTAIVRGKTEPKAFVTVNNQVVEVKDDGSFSAVITFFQAGKNKVEVIARDSSDNETTKTKWVMVTIY